MLLVLSSLDPGRFKLSKRLYIYSVLDRSLTHVLSQFNIQYQRGRLEGDRLAPWLTPAEPICFWSGSSTLLSLPGATSSWLETAEGTRWSLGYDFTWVAWALFMFWNFVRTPEFQVVPFQEALWDPASLSDFYCSYCTGSCVKSEYMCSRPRAT